MATDYFDFLGRTNQDAGAPTINGNSDLTFTGSISQLFGGLGKLASDAAPLVGALKNPKTTTSITTGKPLNGSGIDSKMLLYIGGGVAALLVVILLLKRK